MIVFDLLCSHEHRFEVWFRSSADYQDQLQRHLIACPVCGDKNIRKAITAANVGSKSNQKPAKPAPAGGDSANHIGTAHPNLSADHAHLPTESMNSPQRAALSEQVAKAQAALREIRKFAEQNTDDVGSTFANEARKIHYGEAESRGIRGQSTAEETRALIEEGIEILPLPRLPEDSN